MRQGRFGILMGLGPRGLLRALRRRLLNPRSGEVDFGDLRSLEPVSRLFGMDRGTPIDRHYIAVFIESNKDAVRGRCLEVADRAYTIEYGGDSVTQSDVLYAEGFDDAHSEQATVVGDLTDLACVGDGTYDCVIVTQTLQFIYDFRQAVREIERVLKPGGTCLCTISAISQISRYDMDRWGEYWRMTSLAADRVFSDAFAGGTVDVRSFGNALSAVAGLQGLSAEELSARELEYHDPDYEMLVCIRATKGSPLC